MTRRTPPRVTPVIFKRVERDDVADDPIVRSMLRHGADLEPDPQFERRLRGIVLNSQVAVREGYRPAVARRAMTPIGRGVLISLVLVAASVSSVGAFSQGALPDDVLYPIKLQIEHLRMAGAPPDLQDDLLALALEERAQELSRAADAGRWAAATEAAARVASTEAELISMGGLTPGVAVRVQAHLAALDRILAEAPPRAAAIVAERLDPARGPIQQQANANATSGNASGSTGGNANGATPGDVTGAQGGAATAAPSHEPPPPTPQATPRASQAGRPSNPGAPAN